jgi:copper(I)-binding protein
VTARVAAGGGGLRQVVRAAAGPVSCAAVAIGLLSGWVSIGGAGTITVTKVPRIQVTVATIPMHSLHPGLASAPQPDAPCYLTIHNSSGRPDVLTAVSSPVARRVVLTAPAGAGRVVVTGLRIPAHGTVTLTPSGDDAVVVGGPLLLAGQQVTLTLTFRRAGRVVIEAAVTVPGPP